MEEKILHVVDLVAPIEELSGNQASSANKTQTHIKRKMNLRKRLLVQLKVNGNLEITYMT